MAAPREQEASPYHLYELGEKARAGSRSPKDASSPDKRPQDAHPICVGMRPALLVRISRRRSSARSNCQQLSGGDCGGDRMSVKVHLTKSPFFIVGCPRSGTSLLRNLLRSHPHLAIPSESHFIPPCYRAFGDPANAAEALRTSRFILQTSWLKYWDLEISPEAFADCRTYRELVCRLFSVYARQEGAIRWGDKTPQYVAEMPAISQLFPEAKFIHIIRDGRDVAHSWLRTRYHPRNYYTAAQLWRQFVEAGRSFGASAAKGVYLEIRYESLLADPNSVMRTACEFLDEPFVEAVLNPTPVPRDVRQGARRPADLATLLSGNSSKWESAMTSSEKALFESLAGGLLESLGYEIEGRARPIAAWERGYWRAHQGVLATWSILGLLRQPNRLTTRLLLRLANARGGH